MPNPAQKPKLLVTGFDVFPGAPENPTAWAIRELQKERWQPRAATVSLAVLPVIFDTWVRTMSPLIAKEKPAAVIALGLSAKTTGFTLESTARNTVAIDRPDFTGMCATSDCVSDQGPAIYPTTLPLKDLALALTSSGLPLVRSDDAGDYLCNMLFYNLMHTAAETGIRMAGFIHAPYLDTQIARLKAQGKDLSHGATMTEQDFLRGVKLIIETCAGHLVEA